MTRAALAALVLASLTVLACRGEPPARPRATVSTAEPLDALSRRLGRARRRLRERGYDETDWSLRLFLPEGTGRAEVVHLRRGVCTTFLALSGGSVQELELALFDADGRRAAVDSVRGEGSLVHACPRTVSTGSRTRDAVYYLKARVTGGSGAVAIRAFESRVGSAAGVAGVFDGILAPAEHGESVGTRLGRTIERLRTRGMVSVGTPLVARVLEGEALRRTASLEAGRCYVAIARAEETVRDVALYLLDPSAAEVARDLEGRDEPRIEHCAAESGSYQIEARAAEGSGGVGIALVLDPSAAPAVAAASSAPMAPTREEAGPALVRDAMGALMAHGYRSPRYIVRGAVLRPGEAVTHDVALGAGCSVLLAAPEASDMDLDLYLADADGEVTASDTRITAEARLASCRGAPETSRAVVKTYGREGTYTLVVLDGPEGASDVRRLRLLEATAPFVARRYEPAELEDFQLDRSEERAFPFVASAGSCFLAAVAGGQGLEDVDLALRDADGRVIASDTGPHAWASVSRCVEVDTRYELRVVAYRGAGPVLVQWMRRWR